MQIVINIDENVFTRLFDNGIEDYAVVNDDLFAIAKSIRNGTPLPKTQNHGFLAVCDSDFPITREVIDDLKSTLFVGNEKCSYCFEIVEIIDTDKENENESIG